MAHVYFALHDAYKKLYLNDGHLSDTSKRAALTCAAIIAAKPIHPDPNKNILDMASEAAYANPMLAMRCACSIVRHPFSKRPFDDRRRVYVAYMGLQFPSAEPIKLEARNNGGEVVSNWQITLADQEEAIINMLVDDFVLYSKWKIPEQDSR